MIKNLLAQVYLWTVLVGLASGLVAWMVFSFNFGAGLFLTALWAVAGFRALEGLLRSAVLPPGVPRNVFATVLWILAKLVIYGMAVLMLFFRPFPPVSHAVGFTLMLVVLVVLGARSRSLEISHSKKIQQETPRGDDA